MNKKGKKDMERKGGRIERRKDGSKNGEIIEGEGIQEGGGS